METTNKRLYRSEDDKVIFGVMGGFGEYLDVDPVFLRVLYILLSIFTGFFPALLAYVLMAIIMPKKSEVIREKDTKIS